MPVEGVCQEQRPHRDMIKFSGLPCVDSDESIGAPAAAGLSAVGQHPSDGVLQGNRSEHIAGESGGKVDGPRWGRRQHAATVLLIAGHASSWDADPSQCTLADVNRRPQALPMPTPAQTAQNRWRGTGFC